MIYGVVFFTPIKEGEMDYYTKFGAWFTAIGSIFTIINTMVVIFLMIWLHKKESIISLIPQINDLKKDLITIQSTISYEVNHFNDAQYLVYEDLQHQMYSSDEYHYANACSKEIDSLNDVINKINELYSLFTKFKNEVIENKYIDLNYYQDVVLKTSKLNEILTLKKPSVVYKKGFIDGGREEACPEDMISVAQYNALESIEEMRKILESKALT